LILSIAVLLYQEKVFEIDRFKRVCANPSPLSPPPSRLIWYNSGFLLHLNLKIKELLLRSSFSMEQDNQLVVELKQFDNLSILGFYNLHLFETSV